MAEALLLLLALATVNPRGARAEHAGPGGSARLLLAQVNTPVTQPPTTLLPGPGPAPNTGTNGALVPLPPLPSSSTTSTNSVTGGTNGAGGTAGSNAPPAGTQLFAAPVITTGQTTSGTTPTTSPFAAPLLATPPSPTVTTSNANALSTSSGESAAARPAGPTAVGGGLTPGGTSVTLPGSTSGGASSGGAVAPAPALIQGIDAPFTF